VTLLVAFFAVEPGNGNLQAFCDGRDFALRSRRIPLAASRPARSSCETSGWHFNRACLIRRPIKFLAGAALVFFMKRAGMTRLTFMEAAV
jgi:hypothetical protein